MQRRLARYPMAFWLVSIALLPFGCGDEGPTQIPGALEAPATPTDLIADVGEREVTLTWEVSSAEGVASYRVYRREDSGETFTLLGQPSSASLTDSGLVPGRTYVYRVSSVGMNGIESNPSGEVSVTPGAFALVIDGRAEYTASRSAMLSFTAPADVNAVKVGNDSLLTGAFYEAYQASRTWTLAEGDGVKAVYARFRTAAGGESGVVSDRITLDTRARILSITEDSNGQPLGPGDTLRVTMTTGEAGGAATISIGTALVAEPMEYDDVSGTHVLVRVITPDLSARNEVVIGSFVDRAGNTAPPQATTTTVTLGNTGTAPAPVTLSAGASGDDWIALSWTPSDEIDFGSYVLYRSDQPAISGGAADLVVGVISSSVNVALVDSVGLRDSTTYYYRLFVQDGSGRSTGSNVVSAATRNRAPVAADGFAAAAVDSPFTSVRLTWTAVDASTVHDFAAYELYRSTSEAVSRASSLVATIGEIGTRSFIDDTTAEATTYYYRIYVVDRGGLAAGSAVASALTTDRDPSFVTLNAPNVDVTNQDVILTWAANPDVDFSSYELFWGSASTSGGVSSYALLDVINNRAATSYVHFPDVTDLPLYVEYYLEVTDRTGNRTRSNTVQATFPPVNPPTIVTQSVLPGQTFAIVNFTTDVPTTATVRYSRNTPSYNLTRQDTELKTVHSVTLDALTSASDYFVQVTVTDESGGTYTGETMVFTTLGGP